MSKKKKEPSAKFGLQAFARVQVTQDGKLVGDSGWHRNTVTNYGIQTALAGRLLGGTNYGAYAALGTGTAPATSATALDGENAQLSSARVAASTSVVSQAAAASVTARWYGTFTSGSANDSSGQHTASMNIANIGIYTGSATSGSNLVCGATYSSSAWATNQSVNFTYEWQFATTT